MAVESHDKKLDDLLIHTFFTPSDKFSAILLTFLALISEKSCIFAPELKRNHYYLLNYNRYETK